MSGLEPRLIALDFDGVLCDSAGETAVAAWRTLPRVWPALAGLGDEPTPAFTARFIRHRPLIETGWQTVILARLILLEADDSHVASRFAHEADALRADAGLTPGEMVELFGQTRDHWLAADPEGWLARNRFYPGVMAALTAALRRDPDGVVILTTKQERFTRQLLEHAGVAMPAERIYGLERRRPKEDWLAEFATQRSGAAALTLVEDRLDTLLRVAARPGLDAVRLYLADWGYLTPADHAHAATLARLRPLTVEVFCRRLADGTL